MFSKHHGNHTYSVLMQQCNMAVLIVMAAVFSVVQAGYNKNYFMPGTNCNTIRVREIDGAVVRSTPNKLWSNSACLMKFEADDSLFTSKRLMINIEELSIQNCDVSLKIYFDRTSTGKTPDHTFTCRSHKPGLIYTTGKYATIRLDTRTYKGYSFKIILTSFKESTFCSEFRCINRKCIENKLRCDGINHCGDNSDEVTCSGVHRMRRFGTGSTVASAFSSLLVVGITIGLCIFCVRRRRRMASQGQVLQQQHLMVRTGVEAGPPPPGTSRPRQNHQPGQYKPVPTGYQVPNYNPGVYPPPGQMPPGPGQPPPPYGYPPQPYYPPPAGPAPAYPYPGDVAYPPPGPAGPPPMGPPGMGPPPMGPPGMGPPHMGPPGMGQPGMGPAPMGPPPGNYPPVSYDAASEQVKMPPSHP